MALTTRVRKLAKSDCALCRGQIKHYSVNTTDSFSYRINTEPGNTRGSVFWSLVFGLLVLLDQITKWFVFVKAVEYSLTTLLGVSRFKNYNFAFSIPLSPVLIYLLYLVILSAM